MVIYKLVYNSKVLNCVQEVAGYNVAVPQAVHLDPTLIKGYAYGKGLVGGHGLVGAHNLAHGILAHGLVGGPNVREPSGMVQSTGHSGFYLGKRSAVAKPNAEAAPEVVPTLNLVPTLVHAPAHDSASIESHGLASGNFAYGQGLIGGHGLVGSGPGIAHGLIGGHGIAHGLVGLHGPAHGQLGSSNVREPSGMVHYAGHSGYPGKRSAVAKRTPNTKADANGHGLVGVHGPTPGVVNVLRPDGSILGHYILESGHGLVFVPGRTADVVAPGIGRPLNLARPVVEKRKIRR